MTSVRGGVRLVALDLDGTLLGPDGTIGRSDAEAVVAASRAGVRIVVATGRPSRWLACLDPITDAHPYVIVSNGAAVHDLAAGRTVERLALDRATLDHVAAALRAAFPDAALALEHGERFGCEPGWIPNTTLRAASVADEEAAMLVAPWEELLQRIEPVVKLLALLPSGDMDEIAKAASEAVGDAAVVTHSAAPGDRRLLEISAAGVSKAHTLALFCAEHGVDPADVAAFGDMPNDLAMLEFAGHPFAMGNAHPLLRERFEVVGTNAEGGVGTTLRRLLAR